MYSSYCGEKVSLLHIVSSSCSSFNLALMAHMVGTHSLLRVVTHAKARAARAAPGHAREERAAGRGTGPGEGGEAGGAGGVGLVIDVGPVQVGLRGRCEGSDEEHGQSGQDGGLGRHCELQWKVGRLEKLQRL